MSRVRISKSKATAQAIFVFAITVSLYAALLVLHTELSGEPSLTPLSMVIERPKGILWSPPRTQEVGDKSGPVTRIGAAPRPPEVLHQSQEISQQPPGHGQLDTLLPGNSPADSRSSKASELRGILTVSPPVAQAVATGSTVAETMKLAQASGESIPAPASQTINQAPDAEGGKRAAADTKPALSERKFAQDVQQPAAKSETKSSTTPGVVKVEATKQGAVVQARPQEHIKTEAAKTEPAKTAPAKTQAIKTEATKTAAQDPTLKPSRSIIRTDESWQTKQLLSKLLPQSGPCAKHVPAGDEAMLVRMCCELTEAKLENIKRYSKQTRDVDLWVLYDFRAAGEKEIIQVEEQFRKLQVDHAFSVFMYNSKLAERLYPGGHERLESIRSQVNWAVHEVSIATWWSMCAKHKWGDEVSRLAKSIESRLLPKTVWSVESDAAFSGDVTAFLAYYRSFDEHLVVGWEAKSKEEWIEEKYTQMPNMSVVPHEVIHSKPDAVMRMSSRFLYHLDGALRANFILYGEMYSSTLCRGVYTDWCTVLPLMDGPFYSPAPGGFISTSLVSDEEWQKANVEVGMRNRWYHPVARLKDPVVVKLKDRMAVE